MGADFQDYRAKEKSHGPASAAMKSRGCPFIYIFHRRSIFCVHLRESASHFKN
jgi:hypothetical protein